MAGMFRINSFLLLFKLETGAICIGMAHFGGSLLMAGLCLLYGAIVGLGLLECEVSSHNEFFDSLHKSGMCEVGWVAVPLGFVFLFISLLYVVMSYKLVKGTENRCHRNVRPMMIAYAIPTFFSALFLLVCIVGLSVPGIILGVVSTFYYGYCLIILYSMHENFHDEFASGLIPICHKPDPRKSSMEKFSKEKNTCTIL